MNKIVNKFLIARDKYMPEMAGLVEHLQKQRKYKNHSKEKIRDIFIKTN